MLQLVRIQRFRVAIRRFLNARQAMTISQHCQPSNVAPYRQHVQSPEQQRGLDDEAQREAVLFQPLRGAVEIVSDECIMTGFT